MRKILEFQIAVKNMVCNRCIKVVREELLKNNYEIKTIGLGKIVFKQDITDVDKLKIAAILGKEGFELLQDKETKIVNEVKSLIIEIIHYDKKKPVFQNFSDFIAKNMHLEYTFISKLFSEISRKTIEQFIIEQKIERAKELLKDNELTLSQISYELNYSSPQHLSRQFKQIAGMTPSAFKKTGNRKELDTI